MGILLRLLVGIAVFWSTKAQGEPTTCWSSAVCYKAGKIETEWLKIYPLPNCTSNRKISKNVEISRLQEKFNRSTADFFNGLGEFATNACPSCSSYRENEVNGSDYSYSDTEECFAPVVCGVDGKTIADYIQIRPFLSCKYVKKKSHETFKEMESLFNSSIDYVTKELQHFVLDNCNLCQTARVDNAIANLAKSTWKPPTETRQCYAPVICAKGEGSFENWIKFPDPNCKSANVMLFGGKPEKIFTSILEQTRQEIQDIVEEECSKSCDKKSSFSTSILEVEDTTTSGILPRGWISWNGTIYYKVFSEKKNYSAAEETCKSNGARLAAVMVRDATDELVQQLENKKTYWVGLEDRNKEGYFLWSDNYPYVKAETPWRSYEPSNSGNEDCAEIHKSDGRLNDIPCGSVLGFVCEIPVT